LPMIVSVTLARGAIRMARAHVIVKRLGAIHDLGSMDVLCTDKTGTLTEAKISLARQVALSGADSERVLDLAWLNSHFQAGLRNPLDTAIVESGPPRGAGWAKVDEVPFDFQRRRVSVLVERDGRRLLITKGAPEDIIRIASHYEEPAKPGPLPLDATARARAAKAFEALSDDGFRALGVAWREFEPDRSGATVADEHNLVFAGFVVFFDPPKESAGAAIAALGTRGVGIKILSATTSA
jgi:P-type Mg2+ transporter